VKSLVFRTIKISPIIIILLVILFFGSKEYFKEFSIGELPLELYEPLFLENVRAEDEWLVSYLDEEVGISAWYQGEEFSLDDVRDIYRTIQIETEDYIIGAVIPPDYSDKYEAQVYVNKNGWILAYYLDQDPVAKILDWRSELGRDLDTSILNNILNLVAVEAEIPFTSGTYYDFRYPNATHLLLIDDYADAPNGIADFEISIPGSNVVYERSWSVGYAAGELFIDDVEMGDWITGYGTIPSTALTPDEFHTIEVHAAYLYDAVGGISLLYRVP
jgi:hypothetical protein